MILHTDAASVAVETLNETHPDLRVETCNSYAGLADLIETIQAEVVYSVRFDGTPRFPKQALVDSETVKWISVGGSGTDHLQPWDPARLTVTNAAGVAADMIAEYVLGVILTFSLDLRGFARLQQAREWKAGKVQPVNRQTLLILGLGKTGLAIAARAKAFGMTTLGVRARPKPTAGDRRGARHR